ncbi:MAG: hypothetical protein EPO26_17160 [Chloroflexota bacterium]|nr:MAG: hypothetical protein EPO26_17160 [Chloroflexota bacterium]
MDEQGQPALGRAREPEHLRRGKDFHTRLQASWGRIHGGDQAIPEEHVDMDRFSRQPPASGRRRGRIDIAVDLESRRTRADGHVDPAHRAVLEAKATIFDGKSPTQVRRRIAQHRRQLAAYIGTQADLNTPAAIEDPESAVTPGIIYPQAPTDPAIRQMIEEYFADECITVVWQNELPPELQI